MFWCILNGNITLSYFSSSLRVSGTSSGKWWWRRSRRGHGEGKWGVKIRLSTQLLVAYHCPRPGGNNIVPPRYHLGLVSRVPLHLISLRLLAEDYKLFFVNWKTSDPRKYGIKHIPFLSKFREIRNSPIRPQELVPLTHGGE